MTILFRRDSRLSSFCAVSFQFVYDDDDDDDYDDDIGTPSRNLSWALNHSEDSFLPTHGGMAQAASTSVPDSVPRWFTRPKTVTRNVM